MSHGFFVATRWKFNSPNLLVFPCWQKLKLESPLVLNLGPVFVQHFLRKNEVDLSRSKSSACEHEGNDNAEGYPNFSTV